MFKVVTNYEEAQKSFPIFLGLESSSVSALGLLVILLESAAAYSLGKLVFPQDKPLEDKIDAERNTSSAQARASQIARAKEESTNSGKTRIVYALPPPEKKEGEAFTFQVPVLPDAPVLKSRERFNNTEKKNSEDLKADFTSIKTPSVEFIDEIPLKVSINLVENEQAKPPIPTNPRLEEVEPFTTHVNASDLENADTLKNEAISFGGKAHSSLLKKVEVAPSSGSWDTDTHRSTLDNETKRQVRDTDPSKITLIKSTTNSSNSDAQTTEKHASHVELISTRNGATIAFESIPPEEKKHSPEVQTPISKGIFKKARPYFVPVEGILTSYPDGQYWIIDEQTKKQAEVLKLCLEEFNIQAEVTGIRKGPVITMFEILPAPGVKLQKIVGLSDNIALRLAAQSIRIVAPIPGKHAVGIEVPNLKRSIVSFKEMIESDAFVTKKQEIPVVLGKEISGEVQVIDLAATPHLLIAGSTGSGKSVCVNSIILSILYKRTPEEVRMIMIDPKIVELKLYNDIPHLLTQVITEPKKAFQALQYCLCEMERRYSLLDGMGVRDIRSYNRKIKEKNMAAVKLPYIVVLIDEFADLMATTGKELESTLARLAAMSRAVGIHLVLATQRPSIDVITGLIKANIPSRIAFMVASKMDSRIIMDTMGAEKLLGKGDMLYQSAADPFPVRMQGAFVSEEEVERAVDHIKTLGEPNYIDDEIFIDDDDSGEQSLFNSGDDDDDPLMDEALEIILQAGKASASYLQRRLKIGYNRAARLVELMEERGIVGPSQGSKPRDILRVPERPNRDLLPFRNGDVPLDSDGDD